MKNISFSKENLVIVGERKRMPLNLVWAASALLIALVTALAIVRSGEDGLSLEFVIAIPAVSVVLLAADTALELLIPKQSIIVYADSIRFVKNNVVIPISDVMHVDVLAAVGVFGKRVPEAVSVMTLENVYSAIGIKNALAVKEAIDNLRTASADGNAEI